MKKIDEKFQNLQNAFYKEVDAIIPELFERIHTLMLTREKGDLYALLGFTDITGIRRIEEIDLDVEANDDPKALAEILRTELLAEFPGFVRCSIEEAVENILMNLDDRFIYTIDNEGTTILANYYESDNGCGICVGVPSIDYFDRVPFSEEIDLRVIEEKTQEYADNIRATVYYGMAEAEGEIY